MLYRTLTGREYVFAVNTRERDQMRTVFLDRLAENRPGDDPEFLNDIAEMCLTDLRVGELGAVE